jgi:hypothetical protein
MGMITIKTHGSFPNDVRVFHADNHGHADAVALAIEWLSGTVLPLATAQDHRLHTDNCEPHGSWVRDK